jgi:protease I
VAGELQGKRIAFVATDGVEQVEYIEPRKTVEQAGAEAELVSMRPGSIQGFNHLDKGDTFRVDRTAAEANPDDYDGLVLPGGVANPDFLRTDPDVVRFIRSFFEAGKPVGAICHGPWTLVEAGVVKGRTLTSWPSLQTDIRNAGGTWVDEEVQVDQGLVTSRKPDDLKAFGEKLVEEFAEGVHQGQARATARS